MGYQVCSCECICCVRAIFYIAENNTRKKWNRDFSQLNVGSPIDLPVLRYLHTLQQKVDSFIYHSICGRCIYTLKELQADVVCMLNTFALCPLDTRTYDEDGHQSDGVYDSDSHDSPEYDGGGNRCMSKKSDSQQKPAVCFREFGVGCLFAHPIVERLFGPIPRQVQYYRV